MAGRRRERGTGLDRGDIVLGWLTKLTVTLAVLGLVGFDLLSIGVGRFQTEDRAGTAARAAVRAYAADRDVQRAYDAALATLEEVGAHLDVIDPQTFAVRDDGSVTLTLEHTSSTFLVEKIGPVRGWATARATVSASPAN